MNRDVKEETGPHLCDEQQFAEMVKDAIVAADRGEFVAADEVWARAERVLQLESDS